MISKRYNKEENIIKEIDRIMNDKRNYMKKLV